MTEQEMMQVAANEGIHLAPGQVLPPEWFRQWSASNNVNSYQPATPPSVEFPPADYSGYGGYADAFHGYAWNPSGQLAPNLNDPYWASQAPPLNQPPGMPDVGYGGGSFGGYSTTPNFGYGNDTSIGGYLPSSDQYGYSPVNYGNTSGGSYSVGGNMDLYGQGMNFGELPSSNQYGWGPVDYGSPTFDPSPYGGMSVPSPNLQGAYDMGSSVPPWSEPGALQGTDAPYGEPIVEIPTDPGLYQYGSGSAGANIPDPADPFAGATIGGDVGSGIPRVNPDGTALPGTDPYSGAVVATPFTGGVYNYSGLPTYTQYYHGQQTGSAYGFDPYGSAIGTAPNQAYGGTGTGMQAPSRIGTANDPSGWGSSTKPPSPQQATEDSLAGGNWKADNAYYAYLSQLDPPNYSNIGSLLPSQYDVYSGQWGGPHKSK